MPPPLLRAAFASPGEFLAAFDDELAHGGVLVRGAEVGAAQALSECRVSFEVAGTPPVEVPGRIAAVAPGVGVAVIFQGVPAALADLSRALRAPAGPAADEPEADEPPRGALADRIKAMSVQQKMQAGLSGSREERLALIRDPAKVAHVFVLKNPRIGIDEVLYAAKSPNLAPDAIKLIADHKEWSVNASICAALARNPKTPVPMALRLLDRVPMSELRAIAKGGARDQIVHAARKKVAG
jgi:hypothetical protein